MKRSAKGNVYAIACVERKFFFDSMSMDTCRIGTSTLLLLQGWSGNGILVAGCNATRGPPSLNEKWLE